MVAPQVSKQRARNTPHTLLRAFTLPDDRLSNRLNLAPVIKCQPARPQQGINVMHKFLTRQLREPAKEGMFLEGLNTLRGRAYKKPGDAAARKGSRQ